MSLPLDIGQKVEPKVALNDIASNEKTTRRWSWYFLAARRGIDRDQGCLILKALAEL